MPGVKQRLTALRERWPLVDHVVRMQEHYGEVKAGQQAGAVTYFGFLSVFPILALAFFVIGWIAKVYPDARAALTDAISAVIPGLIGNDAGQIKVDDLQSAASAGGLLGIVSVLVLFYSGLGWLSALRDAMIVVFETPERDQPSFVVGKVRDLVVLAIIGATLIISVAVAGLVSGFATDILSWLGLGTGLSWVVQLITVVVGIGASTLMFYAMFVLLGQPEGPRRPLWGGALLGALGFEILKQLSSILLHAMRGNPAFQAFGLALVLLLWINYFTRVIMYAAAWAYTSPTARAVRPERGSAPVQGPPSPPLRGRGAEVDHPWAAPAAAGAATMLGVVALVRRFTKEKH